MSDAPTTSDLTMDAIAAAVALGHRGDADSAVRDLLSLWRQIGVTGDPLHRCTLAHHLADLCDAPAESLVWDVRALDAADALTDGRVRRHHDALRVAGFYPSLHLNLADDFRRLGAFRAAGDHLDRAEERMPALPDGPYGDTIRSAVREVRQAVAVRDTGPRASAPGPAR